ncbi:O-antigen/teichoic acid export membrane protein [Streptomyces sp. SAI-170]|uniref:lipopolysaccharide biosynthesis protein n=1 Tax=Streptomyces sp. SAI-170 TaxID=3377729 RepID=UPI003C7E348E
MTVSDTGLDHTAPSLPRRPPPPAPHHGTAERGARWITTGAVAVGVLNYGYALVLTRLLDVRAFSVFAAGQRVVLAAASVALVALPWVLAQALARAGSQAERAGAIRFTAALGLVSGLVAAGVVAVIAGQFAGPATTLMLALATLLMYVTTTTLGWLQGTERLRTLACITVSEAALKFAAGVLLVAVVGLSDTGAVAALGICVLPLVVCWPYGAHAARTVRRPRTRVHRDLGRRVRGIAAVQAMVALVASADVVLVALLPVADADAASYQASAMLGRVPLFLASAISTAFFPALSRRGDTTSLTASAVRMYLVIALPVSAVCATVPSAVIGVLFPADYGRMSALLAFAAVSGCAVGALNLAATFSQAVDDFRCVRTQAVGLVLCVAAPLLGWQAGGIIGLAAGSVCGTVPAAALLVGRQMRRRGIGFLARPALLEPLLITGVLIAVRPVPLIWLAVATLAGVRTAARFLRHRGTPPADPAAGPATAAAPRPPAPDGDATRVLRDALWTGTPPPATDDTLRRALTLARRNQVEGHLARAYPEQLADTLAEAEEATRDFRDNLAEATDRLRAHGVPAVLIKGDPAGVYTYDNFDLVVPAAHWQDAQQALSGWAVHRETYWLERSTKILLRPPRGPAAHLHSAVSWFGVPVIPADRLFAQAAPDPSCGCLLPQEAAALRIWLAHALFQNLTLNLSELLALRPLLRPDVIARARRHAAREGWQSGFLATLGVATAAVERLDNGDAVPLPVPLPVPVSLRAGAEHARHLAGRGAGRTAAREAALRLPLVVTKTMRGGRS